MLLALLPETQDVKKKVDLIFWARRQIPWVRFEDVVAFLCETEECLLFLFLQRIQLHGWGSRKIWRSSIFYEVEQRFLFFFWKKKNEQRLSVFLNRIYVAWSINCALLEGLRGSIALLCVVVH